MNGLSHDLRYAMRQLAKSPSFAIVATLSLALGIGATTAVFSVIHGILIDPYPYKDNARMVHPVLYNEKGVVTFLSVTGPELEQVRQAIRRRRFQPVVRLEFAEGSDAAAKALLREQFRLHDQDIYEESDELDYTSLFEVAGFHDAEAPDEILGFRRIDQPRKAGDQRIRCRPGVRMGGN